MLPEHHRLASPEGADSPFHQTWLSFRRRERTWGRMWGRWGQGRDVGQARDRVGTWGRPGTGAGRGAGNGLKAVAVGLSHLPRLLLYGLRVPGRSGRILSPLNSLMAASHPLEVSRLSCLFGLRHPELATAHLRPPLPWPHGSPVVPGSHALPCFCMHRHWKSACLVRGTSPYRQGASRPLSWSPPQ